MRPIDADRLLTERMKSKYYHLPNGDIAIPIIDIEHAPTIDAMSVVRCGDCKHWWECKPRDGGDCDHYEMNTKADDFCSYGEREGE